MKMTKLIVWAAILAIVPSRTFAGSALEQLWAQAGVDSAPALRDYIQREWKGNWNPAWERSLSEGVPLIQLEDGSWQLTPEAHSYLHALARKAYQDWRNGGPAREGQGRRLSFNLDGGCLNRAFVERRAFVDVTIGKDETVALHGISMESEVSLDGHLNTKRESWETKYTFEILGNGRINPQVKFKYTDGAGAGHTGGLTNQVRGETTLENPKVLAILNRNLRFWLKRPAY